MLQGIRRFGVPEYVTAQYVADYLGRPLEAMHQSGFFDGIPYRLTANRVKHYHLNSCLKMMRVYNIDPPCRVHPYAKWRPSEIIADLDVTACAYLNLVKAGKLVEQEPDHRGKFVYYKDYERFIKNYVPMKMIPWLPAKLNIRDAAEFIGTTPNRLKAEVRRGNADAVWYNRTTDGKRRYRWMTREQIIQYITKQLEGAGHRSKKLIRKKPLADVLTVPLTAIYLKTTEVKVKSMVNSGYLEPGKASLSKNKSRLYNVFGKEYLDAKYDHYCKVKFYNEGKCYYTRAAIRNKFGKTNYWITTYIVGKCHELLSNDGKLYTPEERAEENRKLGRIPEASMGWSQKEVEAIVESGVEIDPVVELSEYRMKHLEALDKTNYNELRRKLRMYREKKYAKVLVKPVKDPVEIALRAAFEEKVFRREARISEILAAAAEKRAEENQIRSLLGIDPKTIVTLTPDIILKNNFEPEKVLILYSRNGWNDVYTKHSVEPVECTYRAKDAAIVTTRIKTKVISVFSNIARVARKISNLPPKVSPSWIILAPSSSIVADPSFYLKLDNVPTEYGAVGPFGYEYVLPNGSWVNCPATYGMFSEYSLTDQSKSRRIAGTRSAVGNHEVAVLDGPFVAVRGGYLKLLCELKNFSVLGDGRSFVPFAISMIMRRLGVKMLQIEVDSMRCSDFEPDRYNVQWNRAERMLIGFANPSLKFKS